MPKEHQKTIKNLMFDDQGIKYLKAIKVENKFELDIIEN